MMYWYIFKNSEGDLVAAGEANRSLPDALDQSVAGYQINGERATARLGSYYAFSTTEAEVTTLVAFGVRLDIFHLEFNNSGRLLNMEVEKFAGE